MSVNKMAPHVFVLPEDDANRQLANGFYLENSLDTRRMQILPVAGGWQEVLDAFAKDHVPQMERNAYRFMVLLIDLDEREDRLQNAVSQIPAHLRNRVFVLGSLSNPERLRQALGPYEDIGKALARDCRDNTDLTWTHDLLRQNASEVARMRQYVRPILFHP